MDAHRKRRSYLYYHRENFPADKGILDCLDVMVRKEPQLAAQYIHYALRVNSAVSLTKWSHYISLTARYDRRSKAILSAYTSLIKGKVVPSNTLSLTIMLIAAFRSKIYDNIIDVVFKSVIRVKETATGEIRAIATFMYKNMCIESSQPIMPDEMYLKLYNEMLDSHTWPTTYFNSPVI